MKSHSGHQITKETVTPYKVTLLVLIHEYCGIDTRGKEASETDCVLTESERRHFMITLLQLLQLADLDLSTLAEKCSKMKHVLWTEVDSRLQQFYDNGVQDVMDYFQTITDTLFTPEIGQPTVTRTSLVGLFVRRMVLSFESLSFSQLLKLCQQYKHYYLSWKGHDDKASDSSVSDPFIHGRYSQRQAEFFTSKQLQLIQHNENEALTPKNLQQRIRELLETNPNFAEAHFLSYLNQLRVNEYCGAVHSLYHYFDRHIPPEVSTKTKDGDENRSLRYAALNLAALHCRFGHKEEALLALQEAIRLAQESNDTACLQHTLGWLHRLGEQGNAQMANLLEKAVNKLDKHSYWYLTSLSVQMFAHHNAIAKATPASVFDYLTKSDILNWQHSINDVMSTSHAHKSALWHMYGNRELLSIWSQLLLHLNSADSGLLQEGENQLLSLANLVRYLSHEGELCYTRELLEILKISGNLSHTVVMCEQEMNFDIAMHHGNKKEAQQAIDSMAVIDEKEALYRQAVLMKSSCQLPQALEVSQRLLYRCRSDNDISTAELQARVLLVLAEIHCQTANHSIALSEAMDCLSLSKQHHLGHTISMATLLVGAIQYTLGIPSKCHELLEEILLHILIHGSLYDQARALLLYAKTKVSMTTKGTDSEQKKALLSAVRILDEVLEKFSKLESYRRMKETLYYQAVLYNQLGYVTERNKCAQRYSQLDSQHPTHTVTDISVL